MTDRELLELAAKAAGIAGHYVTNYNWDYYYRGNTEGILLDGPDGCWDVGYVWNPLDDDGDALRLVVQLRLTVEVWDTTSFELAHSCCTRNDINTMRVRHDSDPYAATRRAVVRAAAAIGKEMK